MKKADSRIQKTHDSLFNALITLLDNPKITLKNITVQQICDKAMIHRSTFYLHYYDKYDLFFQGFERTIRTKTVEETAFRLKHPFTWLEKDGENKIFINILRKNEDDHYFTILFNQFIKEKLHEDILPVLSEEAKSTIPLDMQADFYTNTISMLNMWWVKNEKSKTAEEMDQYFWLLCNQHQFNFK